MADIDRRLGTTHVYESTSQTSFRRSIGELWRYREVVWSFAMRSFRLRYTQALLGVAWAVLQPAAFLTLFVLFFRSSGLGRGEDNYVAGTLAALVPWQFVNGAFSNGSESLVAEAGLLRKVYFPRESPLLGSVISYLPDFAINLVLMLVLAPVLGGHLGRWTPMIVPLALLIVITTLAIGLPMAALYVYYRDFRYAMMFISQLALFASPVAFAVERIRSGWRPLYAIVNPFVGPLVGFRRVIGGNRAPDWRLLGLSMLSTLALAAFGYRSFKRLEREFADVV